MTAVELWWRAGVLLVSALVIAALRVWHRVKFARIEPVVMPEVKQYPPGCTCIRGAFLDNPSCPHHGADSEAER